MYLQRILHVTALSLPLLMAQAQLGARVAHAGPNEEVVELATHPTSPDRMVLRYDYGGGGLFLTDDGGQSWKLMCNAAIQSGLTRGGPVVMAADGKIFMGLFDGMLADNGGGCDWAIDSSLSGSWIRDVVAHPTDPDLVYAVTSTGGVGGADPANGMQVRDGTGAWAPLGSQDPVLIHRLHVVELDGGGMRFYMSAQRSEQLPDGGPAYITRYSDDNGETWTEFDYGATDRQFRVTAVDPTNPDRLLGTLSSLSDESADTVIMSSDRGETWSDYATLSSLTSVAFAPDGRVWLGDGGGLGDVPRGLWYAESLADEPTKIVDSYDVNCLRYHEDESLFLCQPFYAGRFDLATMEFEKSFDITKVEEFATCPGQDMQASCRDQLLSGYCGITHFPFTPVCEPYGVDLDPLLSGNSGCAFDFDAGIGAGTDDAGQCLDPVDGGTVDAGGGGLDAGMMQEPTNMMSGAGTSGGGPTVAQPDPMQPSTGNSGAGEENGGCSAASLGAAGTRAGGAGLALFSVLLLSLRARRWRWS